MIKCNVTVCGNIVSSAEEKTTSEGNKFMSYALVLGVAGRDNSVKELHINVSAPLNYETKSNYSTGRRVTVNGTLYVRKHEGVQYFNLRTDTEAEFNESTVPDRMEGNMDFKGKISKKGIESRRSKKGNEIQTFSAFSSDKNGENREFTWVNFLSFTTVKTDFCDAEKYVEIQGDLKLNVYQSKLQLECIVKSVAPWDISGKNDTESEN